MRPPAPLAIALGSVASAVLAWWAGLPVPIVAGALLAGLAALAIGFAGRRPSAADTPPKSLRDQRPAIMAAGGGLAVVGVLFVIGSSTSNVVADIAILFSIVATLLVTGIVTGVLYARGRVATQR